MLKEAIIEVCVEILHDEYLKQVVEKTQSLEELKEVLSNASISNYQKQIRSYKILIKDRIKSNPNYGLITKKVFENIIDSDMSPKEMVNKYFEYISTNDPRC
jgi:hypothetical protein